MINKTNIANYQGLFLSRGDDFLYVLPNVLLRPYLSCYTITIPANIPDTYTLLPSASSTMVMAVSNHKITGTLRGVNTKICNIGKHANKAMLLLLIEFHSGCLFPFIRANQSDFVNLSLELRDIDKSLMQAIENAMLSSQSIEALVLALDKIRKDLKLMVMPYLQFNGNCEEAFNFYADAFGGKISFLSRLNGDTHNPVMHATVTLTENGGSVSGADVDKHVVISGMSILVLFPSRERIDEIAPKLSEGGTLVHGFTPHPPPDNKGGGAEIIDKYGHTWFLCT